MPQMLSSPDPAIKFSWTTVADVPAAEGYKTTAKADDSWKRAVSLKARDCSVR